MRNNPTTPEFFEEELLPLFEDCIFSLLDADPDPDDEVIDYRVDAATKDVFLEVRLPRKDASRVIGREHRTRHALYVIYAAICRNYGFNLTKLVVTGLQEAA